MAILRVILLSQKTYNENGIFKSKFGSKGCKVDQFNYPLGVAITPNNQLAVTDSVNACVKVFSTDGQLVQLCGDESDFPYGIAVSIDGFFIVTDIQALSHNTGS